jgi:hypothetical protein
MPIAHIVNSRTGRRAAVAAAFMALSVFAPAANAWADDEKPSPSTPTIRQNDRGYVSPGGASTNRGVTKINTGGPQVTMRGGKPSEGAPILIKDGNPADLQVIQVDDAVICSKSQDWWIHSKNITCTR